jgi:hypothetical protein
MNASVRRTETAVQQLLGVYLLQEPKAIEDIKRKAQIYKEQLPSHISIHGERAVSIALARNST